MAEILDRATKEDVPPHKAAVAMAGERVNAAMNLRRWR
jgi:hypothetical protein